MDPREATVGAPIGRQPSFRFKAFVSYSHAADGGLAPALQGALQSFTKPWYALRSCRVFRDKTTLAVTSALWPAIERALLASEYFVLLASPEAAASRWVVQEVERWCEARTPSKLLLVLTSGEIVWNSEAVDFDWTRTTALPRSLSKRFDHEPLFLDIRWARSEQHLSLRHPPFLELVADLSSTLRGLNKDDLIGREVREHRRARRIVQASITVLLLLLFAAGAFWLRAERALALAESRRKQARGVAETIAFDVSNTLLGVPEASDIRKRLNQQAEELLGALGGADTDFRATRATMALHAQRGKEALKRRELRLANQEWLESLRLAKQLSAQQPMNAEFLRDVSVCLSNLGEVATEAKDLELARRYVDEDVVLTRQLVARQPEKLRVRMDLSISLEKLGTLCLALGDRECARAALEEDLKIMQELHDQYPTNMEVTKGMAVALVQTGEMRLQRRRLADARAAFAKAVELNRELVTATPEDARTSRDLSVSFLKLGDTDVQMRAPATALASFEEALALRRRLLARNPADQSAIRDVAVVLGRIASARFQTEGDVAGLLPMSEAIGLYEALVKSSPHDEELRRELAINLYDLAGAEIRLEQFQKAREHLARSVASYREIGFQAALSFPHQELFQALRRAGLVELELDDSRSAAALHEEACSLAKSVPDDLSDDQAVELVLDLHQVAMSHLKLYPGDRRVGVSCGGEAERRLGLLRVSNETAWHDKPIQDVLRELNAILPK